MSKSQRKPLPTLQQPERWTASSAPLAFSRKNLVWLTFFALATVIAYLPALNAGFIWDDDQYVTGNPTLRSLAGLGKIWFKIGAVPQYYPLVHTTFWLEYHLWGLNPLGFHCVNVLLHICAATLAWRLLEKLRLPGAWLAAAIFAMHPVQVESVAWITERKNVLSAVCYFASALAFLHFLELRDANGNRRRRGVLYLSALFLFVLAMWSKTVACSLPAALLLVRWWKRGRLEWADVRRQIPFFVVGAGLASLTVWMEKHVVGAAGAQWELGFVERSLQAGRALWFYAAKLLWPANLTFIYPRWQIDRSVWWQWLFPLAALAVVTTLWCLRRRIGRGPLAAVLIFGGTLFPALGFINVYPFRYSFVADHFQYLASISLIALFASSLYRKAVDWSSSLPVSTSIVQTGFVCLPLLLAFLTWKQTFIYHDLETLWRDTLAKNPSSAIAHNNLGTVLSARGDSAEAESHYRTALEAEPDDAETLSNLAVSLSEQGRIDAARELLQRAVTLAPDNAKVQCNLGKVLANCGENPQAVTALEAAVRLDPWMAEFHYNLGSVLTRLGQSDRAIEQFRQAIDLKPDYADARNNLALVLAGQSKYDQAIEQYGEVLRYNPNHVLAHNNLGNALMRIGRLDEATTHFREALRLKPDYANARFNLGNALALQKKYREAAEEFRETLRLAPDFVPARKNLGIALARLGQRQEALEQLTEALRLQPDNEEVKQQLRALEVPSSE